MWSSTSVQSNTIFSSHMLAPKAPLESLSLTQHFPVSQVVYNSLRWSRTIDSAPEAKMKQQVPGANNCIGKVHDLMARRSRELLVGKSCPAVDRWLLRGRFPSISPQPYPHFTAFQHLRQASVSISNGRAMKWRPFVRTCSLQKLSEVSSSWGREMVRMSCVCRDTHTVAFKDKEDVKSF